MRCTLALVVLASACWTKTKDRAEPKAVAPAPKQACDRDAIVETVCGSGCAPNADALRSIDIAQLYVTKPAAPIGTPFAAEDRAVFRAFTLDRAATTRYRDELTSEEELSREAIEAHCCYSRCSPLVVGVPTGAKPPSSLPTPELCIPRPVAGTSVGAPGDLRCPHGVKLDGALRPYVKTVDERCCYDMRM
jgi:hypothetical protein